MELLAIDYLIIVAYFVVVLVVGLICTEKAGQSLADYFVSGRQFTWWVAGTSMVATTFAADTPLAVTSLVVKQGIAGNWFWWALALSGSLTVFLFAQLWRRSEVLTDVELIELRYGGAPAALLRAFRACYVSVIVNSIIIAWVTGAMVTILKVTLPPFILQSVNDWLIIWVLLAMVGVYSTMSGLWGVALTDVLQFVIAMGGCIALAVIAVQQVGGMAVLEQRVIEAVGPGHLSFLPDFTSAKSPLPWHVFVLLVGVQWWASWFPGAEPGGGGYVVQRLNSCRDERHAVWAAMWFQIAHYCLRPWPWILVALVALVQYPELLTSPNPGEGYVRVMKDFAPPGLRGLMLAAFFAAYMSTISTQMNWGASYLIRDVYQRFVAPGASETELVRASRYASALVLVLGGIASYVFRNHNIDELWKMLAALGAGTGLVFMLRWWWWRVTSWTEIAAMGFSLLFYTLVSRVHSHLRALNAVVDSSAGVEDAQQGALWSFARSLQQMLPGGGVAVDDTHVMAVVAGLTIVATMLVTFLLPAEKPETLRQFYVKVRPPRWGWGHIAAQHPEVAPEGNFALALGLSFTASLMVYLALPAIGFWLFGKVIPAMACTVGAIIAGAIVSWGLRIIAPATSLAKQ